MATAEQKAWRKKFGKMYGGGKKRKVYKARPTKQSIVAKRKTRTVYAKVRRAGRRTRGGLGSARGIFRDVSAGIGGGEIAQTIAGMAAPQFAPVAGPIGAYLAGGVKGLVGKVAIDLVKGEGGLMGMFGGTGSSQGESI